jgi:hypothetical protein
MLCSGSCSNRPTMAICIHLCITDKKSSGIETQERKGREVGVPDWIVLIEGSWTSAVDRLLAGDLALHGPEGPVDRGLYRLQFSRADAERNVP